MTNPIKLRPYQQAALDRVQFLPSFALFFGTGSGKTFTSLARVPQNGTNRLLIVCPAKVIDQWAAEFKKILPDYELFNLPKKSRAADKNELFEELVKPNQVVIVNYEILYKLDNLVRQINSDWTVILDESHKIKDLGSKKKPNKATAFALALGRLTPFKIILTATPTQKDYGGYIDYYAQLRFLGYMENMTLEQFKHRYCITKSIQPAGIPYPIPVITGYMRTHELDNLLQDVAVRYVPKFNDFEPQHIKIDIDMCPHYRKIQDTYPELAMLTVSTTRIVKKTITGGVIQGMDQYKSPVIIPDNDLKIGWVEEFLGNTDETIVIFYKYNVELAQLEELCKKLKKKYIVINGANHDKYNDVQKKQYDVVLGQFAAAGESIDGLQHRSHIVVYYSMPESSIEYTQSLGRIDRDGQKYVPMYYYLVMKKTIDESIYKMIQSKVEFSEDILNKLCLKEVEE